MTVAELELSLTAKGTQVDRLMSELEGQQREIQRTCATTMELELPLAAKGTQMDALASELLQVTA